MRDRLPRSRRHGALSRSLALLSGVAILVGGASSTQDAVANGDTRTLSIYHTHTKESATITFKRDGRYDRAALEQLNWLLRDWRIDEPTKMDPRLFDTVWEAYRSVGSSEPINVVSAYRSPGTNAMLRRRSRGVAEFSQHTRGKAMDFHLPDVSVDRIRAVGMQMQRGGVGWYPSAGSPFVHLDVGSVRSWPRMSHDQLARLFPDGRTVHLPTDNRPLARYEEARADILSRGGTVLGYTQYAEGSDEDEGPSLKGFFAGLFGGGGRSGETPAPAPASAKARTKAAVVVASADPEDTTGTRAALGYAASDSSAKSSLLRRDGRDAQSLLTAETPAAAPQDTVQAIMPSPPRRPAEFAAVAAALAMPLPPPRPSVQVAGLGGMANLNPARAETAPAADPLPVSARIPADADPRAQLRWLFAVAVAQSIDRSAPVVHVALARPRAEGAPEGLVARPADAMATRFSTQATQAPTTSRFSGSSTQALMPRW
ncbi:DUF882 domain-containing protein [uncultured Methylobacterium sp.]|uniref:DUF882 domain-containing protein n=1 Tax=uncultured Methylobacterium sp. TaxID=157278 RepID=UPI0035CAA618